MPSLNTINRFQSENLTGSDTAAQTSDSTNCDYICIIVKTLELQISQVLINAVFRKNTLEACKSQYAGRLLLCCCFLSYTPAMFGSSACRWKTEPPPSDYSEWQPAIYLHLWPHSERNTQLRVQLISYCYAAPRAALLFARSTSFLFLALLIPSLYFCSSIALTLNLNIKGEWTRTEINIVLPRGKWGINNVGKVQERVSEAQKPGGRKIEAVIMIRYWAGITQSPRPRIKFIVNPLKCGLTLYIDLFTQW